MIVFIGDIIIKVIRLSLKYIISKKVKLQRKYHYLFI